MTASSTDATPTDTRAEMTRLAARGYVLIRHLLVQLPEESPAGGRGSILGRAVHQRRHRALVLYLLLLTCWPWLSRNHDPLPAGAWIRALTSNKPRALTWSASTLSRAWRDLEDLGLVERTREGRAVRITPRREDGAELYDLPAGRKDRMNAYFVLPDRFWIDEIFAQLSLPGLAMLLIVAKETNHGRKEMYLPYDKGPAWYGISPKTVQNGVKDLESHGLLHRREEPISAPLSATGGTLRIWYSLRGDFGNEARAALRRAASEARGARLSTDTQELSADPRG